MDIQKVKNYNQKMLAVITTAAVIFAIIGLFSFIIFVVKDVFDLFGHRNRIEYVDDGIPSERNSSDDIDADENNKQKLYVSYTFPHLVDTAKQLFIIPVSLENEEDASGRLSTRGGFSGLGSYSKYDYTYNATFVNLLVYDAKTNLHEKMFEQQMLIGAYTPVYFENDILVVFEAAQNDTDKNGVINLSDNTSLFVYSINNKILKEAKKEGKTVLDFRFIAKTKDIIIRFGKRQDNWRDKKKEPFDAGVLCKYNYEKDQLIDINNKKLNKELKTIAEGKGN